MSNLLLSLTVKEFCKSASNYSGTFLTKSDRYCATLYINNDQTLSAAAITGLQRVYFQQKVKYRQIMECFCLKLT